MLRCELGCAAEISQDESRYILHALCLRFVGFCTISALEGGLGLRVKGSGVEDVRLFARGHRVCNH